MLMVKSSVSSSSSVPYTGSSGRSSRSIVTERSRSRYGTCNGSRSVIPARQLVLVERVDHGLASHGEVAALGKALVVLGHEDAAMVRVTLELHAEHVPHLALLEVGRGPEVHHGRHARVVRAHAQLHVQPV